MINRQPPPASSILDAEIHAVYQDRTWTMTTIINGKSRVFIAPDWDSALAKLKMAKDAADLKQISETAQ